MAAAAFRPTGPAAAAASTPIVSLPRNRLSVERRVLKTRIRSVDCMPACHPKLPPVIVRNVGACHRLLASRMITTPRPCRIPTTKPPLTTLGMIATASALTSILRGICCAATVMKASSTDVDVAIRLSPECCWAGSGCQVQQASSSATETPGMPWFIASSPEHAHPETEWMGDRPADGPPNLQLEAYPTLTGWKPIPR